MSENAGFRAKCNTTLANTCACAFPLSAFVSIRADGDQIQLLPNGNWCIVPGLPYG